MAGKRLVICCDGTWNTPDQISPTNVTKVALAVAPVDDSVEQRVFYHRGVGTSRRERIRGGLFGMGLSRNVIETYRFLVQNYEPGDTLYFFGFSRGAFTARSTVGLVRNAGILRPAHIDKIPAAYELYRSRAGIDNPRGREAALFRRSYSHEVSVHFIGVWDTVGALGIPVGVSPFVSWINRRWAFHNTDLSTTVEHAFQALAIDEKRRPFRPAVWNVQASAPASQEVEQVWFSGVHSNVGGGYADHGLSDLALLWMVEHAQRCGLRFSAQAFQRGCPGEFCDDPVRAGTWVSPASLGPLQESRTRWYRLLPPLHRTLSYKDPKVLDSKRDDAERWRSAHGKDPANTAFWTNGEYVATTAVQRRRAPQSDYRPPGFVQFLTDEYVPRRSGNGTTGGPQHDYPSKIT